jgi:DNA helicase-2/ATP-dependent DNA helicase PcrA
MSGYLQRDEILFIRGMIAIALKDLEAVKSYEVRAAIIDALAIFGEAELTPQRLEQAKHEVAKNPHLLGDFFQLYLDPAQQRPGAQAAISATVAWIKDVAPDTQASVVLQEICTRMNLAVAAKRIFVRPYDASVVARSIDGLLAAAATSGQDLRQFWQTLNAAEAFATRKRDKNAVLIECAANAKGKEFDHVILPFLETGEFPDRISDPTEERNLFYVAATRAKARLTLLSPTDAASRSVFINQMNLVRSSAAADQALAANERRTEAAPPSRHYLAVSFAEGPAAKALGAKFDWTRKAWYVEAGADLKPFAAWLK